MDLVENAMDTPQVPFVLGGAMRLVLSGRPDVPGLDTAIARVLMVRAGTGEARPTLRLHRPGSVLAFGGQDTRHPRYLDAAAAARSRGFEPVERLAGGRAAVFHPQTIAFSMAVPDEDPPRRTTARFEFVAALIAAALRDLGVDARIGEVPGEYCPGEWSVNAGGARKLMGVGQRLVRGAAHVGGVIVVGDTGRIRDVLLPVYEALDFEWEPATVGAVAEEAPVRWEEVRDAVVARFSRLIDLEPGDITADELAAATTVAPRLLSAVR